MHASYTIAFRETMQREITGLRRVLGDHKNGFHEEVDSI